MLTVRRRTAHRHLRAAAASFSEGVPYAIQAGFDPTKDTLATEKADGLAAKTYQNILVVKEGNENTAKTKELKKALKSDEVRDYINKNYKGAVVPVF